MTAQVAALWRFPVKGLPGEEIDSVDLTANKAFPGDRLFGIAHSNTSFDPNNPDYVNFKHFYGLTRTEKLAQLGVSYDEETGELALLRKDKVVSRGKPADPLGRTLIAQFLSTFLGDTGTGAPKLLTAPGHHFGSFPEPYISILNLASVLDLERVMREPVDPRRFRMNVWLDGLPAWAERDWVGQEIVLGGLRVKICEETERCAATNVNPDTAERDMNLPLNLRRGFRHINCGVYGVVLEDGRLEKGSEIKAPSSPRESLPF